MLQNLLKKGNENLDLGLAYKSYFCCPSQVSNKEDEPERSMETGYLWQAHIMLQKIQESIQKREREVTELLQSERRYNQAMKPQITVLIFLKTLVNTVRTQLLQRRKATYWIFLKVQWTKSAVLFIIVIVLKKKKRKSCFLYIDLKVTGKIFRISHGIKKT